MSDGNTGNVNSDLFWIRGYVEGGICARRVMGKDATGELAQLIEQDIKYLRELERKVTQVIRQLGLEKYDET